MEQTHPISAPGGTEQEQEAISIDFGRYLQAFRKYIWLVAAMVVLAIGGAVLYTTRQIPVYEAVASVQVEPRLPDVLGTGDLFNVAAAGANSAEYFRQQKQVLDSYMLCNQTVTTNDLVPKLLTPNEIKELSRDDQIELASRRLQQAITVKYPDQDRIFYIYVRNADKDLAASIANQHVDTYINYSRGLLTVNSNAASDALQAEFNEAEVKLRAVEKKINQFQTDNDMIAVTLEERQSLVAQNILAFSQKLNDQKASEIALAAKLAQMKKAATVDVLETPIVMMGDNPSFETMRATYYTEKIHLLELEKEVGPKNPDYVAQKEKVDEMYKALTGEVKILVDGTNGLYNAATATDSGLAAELERNKAEAKALTPKILVYNDYMREKKDIEDKYNILRARLQTTQMTGSMSSLLSNIRKLDQALTPTTPVSPNMRTNVLVAGVMALILSLGLIVLLVFLDRTIKSTGDATAAAKAPVLGVIPMLSPTEVKDDDRARDLYVHENPTSHVAELCRSLRTNILFSAADRQSKTIVVCSANPREGKTTTVMYLGTTMAQSGQKVLLIDTDMRRPRLHTATGVSSEPGLSNLILGDDDYDKVIKPTEIPNLFVLPCGPRPPNPAELIMTKRFEHVLEELGKRFSRIILDSPPTGPVTDAVVLSRRADGVILVVRASKTLRDELKRSAKQIRDVGGAIFGVIVNELSQNERGYYYYSGYYGYGGDEKNGKKKSKAAS